MDAWQQLLGSPAPVRSAAGTGKYKCTTLNQFHQQRLPLQENYEGPMDVLEAMKQRPQTSMLHHYRQEEKPESWDESVHGDWSPSDFFGIAFPSANRTNSDK